MTSSLLDRAWCRSRDVGSTMSPTPSIPPVTRRPRRTVRRWLDRHIRSARLAAPVAFEHRIGAAGARDRARRGRLHPPIDTIVQRFGRCGQTHDRKAAESAAALTAGVALDGRRRGRIDSENSGTAVVYGLTLVTRTTRNFDATRLDLLDSWTIE